MTLTTGTCAASLGGGALSLPLKIRKAIAAKASATRAPMMSRFRLLLEDASSRVIMSPSAMSAVSVVS